MGNSNKHKREKEKTEEKPKRRTMCQFDYRILELGGGLESSIVTA